MMAIAYLPATIAGYTWPWLVVAWILVPVSRSWPAALRVPCRVLPLALACAIVVSGGGGHASPFPAWYVLLNFDGGATRAVSSIAVTWLVFSAVGLVRANWASRRVGSGKPCRDVEAAWSASPRSLLRAADQWIRTGVVAWGVFVALHAAIPKIVAVGAEVFYARQFWATQSGVARHLWSSIPEAPIVMFLLVLPAEFLSRKHRLWTVKLVLRSVVWSAMCFAVAAPREFGYPTPYQLALPLSALSSALLLSTMTLPEVGRPSVAPEAVGAGGSGLGGKSSRRWTRIVLWAGLTAGSLLVLGGGLSDPVPRVTLENRSGSSIGGVQLRFGSTEVGVGSLADGADHRIPLVRFPEAGDYEVGWCDPDGQEKRGKFHAFTGHRLSRLDLRVRLLGDDEVMMLDEDVVLGVFSASAADPDDAPFLLGSCRNSEGDGASP